MHFFNFDHLIITLQSSDLIWGINFVPPSLSLPPSAHLLLPSSSCPWLPIMVSLLLTHLLPPLIFSLKWCLQSPFLLLHSAEIDLQEAKDSIDEEDPRPTSSTWSYIILPNLQCTLAIISKYLKLGLKKSRTTLLNKVYLIEKLTTLYTFPKPPTPNLLLSKKWFVALEMVEKSNIVDNSTSSPSLVLQMKYF